MAQLDVTEIQEDFSENEKNFWKWSQSLRFVDAQ